MGVPVVTLRGESHGARFGESLLKNANLRELIAKTPEDYVQIAAALASDPATDSAWFAAHGCERVRKGC